MLGIHQSRDQLGQRGLAGARVSDQGHDLTCAELDVDGGQHRARFIGEADPREMERRGGHRCRCLAAIGNGRGSIEDAEDSAGSRARLLRELVDLGDALEGLVEEAQRDHECDQLARL